MFRDLVSGAVLLGRGARLLVSLPRLLALGAIPALITVALLVGALTALVVGLPELSTWLTPFADGWSDGPRRLMRVLAGAALLVGAAFVSIVSFTALTLVIGGPIYERIAEVVDDRFGSGDAGAGHLGWLRSAWRGLGESVLLVIVSLLCGAGFFLSGLIPVVGQTVVPVVAVCATGWLLALELTGVALRRRGMRLAERHRTLRRRRALTLGFGVPVAVLCAIPLAAIVVMPVAAAGGSLLAREVARDGELGDRS